MTSLTGISLLLLLLMFTLKMSNMHQHSNVPQSRKNNTMNFPCAHHSDSPTFSISLHFAAFGFSFSPCRSIVKLKSQPSRGFHPVRFHAHLLWPRGQSHFLASSNAQPIPRLPYLSQKCLLRTGGRGKKPPAGRPRQPRWPLGFFFCSENGPFSCVETPTLCICPFASLWSLVSISMSCVCLCESAPNFIWAPPWGQPSPPPPPALRASGCVPRVFAHLTNGDQWVDPPVIVGICYFRTCHKRMAPPFCRLLQTSQLEVFYDQLSLLNESYLVT